VDASKVSSKCLSLPLVFWDHFGFSFVSWLENNDMELFLHSRIGVVLKEDLIIPQNYVN
jgi:hypothetical protein